MHYGMMMKYSFTECTCLYSTYHQLVLLAIFQNSIGENTKMALYY